jgi:hypothetical protein
VPASASLAKLHAVLQVAFGWSDEHLYTFQIRGWQFGNPSRAIELALAGGAVDIPLAAFAFAINETCRYQYNLFVPWEIDCRIEARGMVATSEPTCLAAQGDPPDEDLGGPAAYPEWLESTSPAWTLHQVEELLDEGLDDEQFRVEAREILGNARLGQPRRRAIDRRLRQLSATDWDAGRLYENEGSADH